MSFDPESDFVNDGQGNSFYHFYEFYQFYGFYGFYMEEHEDLPELPKARGSLRMITITGPTLIPSSSARLYEGVIE